MKMAQNRRGLRMFLALSTCLTAAHVICSVTNRYTTQTYIDLARHPRTSYYAESLHDFVFELQPVVPKICLTHLELLSDVALWIIGARLLLALTTADAPIEETALSFIFHSTFMGLVQVATTLPASGGLEECLSYNKLDENGQLIWPNYGVSFITQSFAGGRACADMLYSGHTAVCIIFTFGTHASFQEKNSPLSVVLSVLLVTLAVLPLVYCHGHYTADVVLAAGIAPLIYTSRATASLGKYIRRKVISSGKSKSR